MFEAVPPNPALPVRCPYCTKQIVKKSRDHIFPDFLGGRRRIVSCPECNKLFGDTFEPAAAVTSLHPLHISISSWGLSLKNVVPAWRRAFEHEGLMLDIASDGGQTKLRLSRPLVERNKKGELIAISFPDRKSAEKAVKQSKARGKSKELTIETIRRELPAGIPFQFQIDPNLNRTALKMCVALSTLLPNFSVEEVAGARGVLLGSRSSSSIVAPSFETYADLDRQREPLSHLIYVERTSHVYGVVQFFGVIQLYCCLGPAMSTTPAAFLASLDPVHLKETFRSVKALSLVPPSDRPYSSEEIDHRMATWNQKFRDSAIQRNATAPPKLVGNTYVWEEGE